MIIKVKIFNNQGSKLKKYQINVLMKNNIMQNWNNQKDKIKKEKSNWNKIKNM